MTASLNSVITDSSPGMSAYVTGQKSNNNQEGVFPDNTPDAFDNPRVEYLGELLRRTRGPGFNVGIVTTADVTDSTPAANAVHTSDRYAGAGIAAQFFDERETQRRDRAAGRRRAALRAEERRRHAHRRPPPRRGIRSGGLRARLNTARDVRRCWRRRRRRARCSACSIRRTCRSRSTRWAPAATATSWRCPTNAAVSRHADARGPDAAGAAVADAPFASRVLPDGGGRVDRQARARRRRGAHDLGHDRVRPRGAGRARLRARAPMRDARSGQRHARDRHRRSRVRRAGDHRRRQRALRAGDDRQAPCATTRPSSASARPGAELLPQLHAWTRAAIPTDPDPSRKLLLGWAAAPDHYENWLSNRLQPEAAVVQGAAAAWPNPVATAPTATATRGSPAGHSRVPCGRHDRERRDAVPAPDGCPARHRGRGHTYRRPHGSGRAALGDRPGAWQFTGVYENTDVFLKILRAAAGTYGRPRPWIRRVRPQAD